MNLPVALAANRDQVRQAIGFIRVVGIEVSDVMDLSIPNTIAELTMTSISFKGELPLWAPRAAVVGSPTICASDEGINAISGTKPSMPRFAGHLEGFSTMFTSFLEKRNFSLLLSTSHRAKASSFGNTRARMLAIRECVIAALGSTSLYDLGLDPGFATTFYRAVSPFLSTREFDPAVFASF